MAKAATGSPRARWVPRSPLVSPRAIPMTRTVQLKVVPGHLENLHFRPLGPRLVRLAVRLLLSRHGVDPDPHALELQACDLAVDVLRNAVHDGLELVDMGAQPFE